MSKVDFKKECSFISYIYILCIYIIRGFGKRIMKLKLFFCCFYFLNKFFYPTKKKFKKQKKKNNNKTRILYCVDTHA